jgi:hypothetical protein
VVELFANMDLAQLSAIVADGVLEELKADPWSTPSEKPGKLSLRALDAFVLCIFPSHFPQNL